MALTDPFKDRLGSHKLWEGVWDVQASLNISPTCLVGTGEEVTLGWRTAELQVNVHSQTGA